MASGILGKANPAAATNTTVYTVPADKVATVNISICNRGGTAANVRVALAATGTPGDDEFIEYGTSVLANGVLERFGVMIGEGTNVVVYSDAATVSVMVFGAEG